MKLLTDLNIYISRISLGASIVSCILSIIFIIWSVAVVESKANIVAIVFNFLILISLLYISYSTKFLQELPTTTTPTVELENIE